MYCVVKLPSLSLPGAHPILWFLFVKTGTLDREESSTSGDTESVLRPLPFLEAKTVK